MAKREYIEKNSRWLSEGGEDGGVGTYRGIL